MKKEGLKLANRLNVSQSEKEGLNGWGNNNYSSIV